MKYNQKHGVDTQFQYNLPEIIDSEKLFGRNFYFVGGAEEVSQMLLYADLQNPKRILDIGSGIGGPAFLMARKYNACVDGIDLSSSMHQLAKKRVVEEGLTDQVHFFLGDILTEELPGAYDLIFSSSVFLHIHKKDLLIERIFNLLNKGGKLLFGDYCIDKESDDMQEYISKYNYHLLHMEEWHDLLARHGFHQIAAIDCTERFAEKSKELLQVANISPDWVSVIQKRNIRVSRGEQKWCVFCCQR